MKTLIIEFIDLFYFHRTILIFVFLTLLYIVHYAVFVVKKPKLFTGNITFRKFLNKHVPTLQKSYWPPLFLQSGTLQTIFAINFRPKLSEKVAIKRQVFEFSDGGETALDIVEPDISAQPDLNPLLVLIIPASFCSTKVSIVASLVDTVVRAGCTAVVLNYRGACGISFKSPKFNTYADCEDVKEVVPYLKMKFPGSRIMAIGQSAGGMILAKYIREHQKEAKEYLLTAMMISMGWDMFGGYRNMNAPHYLNLWLHRQHLSWMKMKASKYSKEMGKNAWKATVNYTKAMEVNTIYDFDKLLLVPQLEYQSVEDYWEDASSRGSVLKFSIPVFSLNAEDDPGTPAKLLPYEEAEHSNSKLALVVTSKGGHNGFLEGILPKSEHFVERIVYQFITAVKTHGHELPL